jgi:hypothetical protein
VLQILSVKGIESAAGVSVLTQNPRYRERAFEQNLSFVVAGAGR